MIVIKNTTKEVIDPLIIDCVSDKHRICIAPGEEVRVEIDEHLVPDLELPKGVVIVEEKEEVEEKLTKDEIKARLEELGIDFPSKARKAELQKLLDKAQG